MSLETRSNSALMKRAEQLKRWQDSETFREPGEPKRKTRKVNFANAFEHFSASHSPPPALILSQYQQLYCFSSISEIFYI
jgi:hypothetical protein